MNVKYKETIEVNFFKARGKWYTEEYVTVEFESPKEKDGNLDRYNYDLMTAAREAMKSHRLNNEMYAVADKGLPFPLMVLPRPLREELRGK